MNDLIPGRKLHPRKGPVAPGRSTLTLAGMVVAIGAATLFVLGVECALYLALSGEPPSLALVVQQAPRWFCGLLRVCSS
jgi:hypothetical protein